MVDVRSDGRPRSPRLVAAMTLVGLVAGVPAGWGTGKLIRGTGVQHLPWSDVAALAIAMLYLAVGLLMAVFSIDRRGLALLANPRAPEFDRPVGAAQRLHLSLQAAVTVLAGVLLAAQVAFDVLAAGYAAAGRLIWMVAIASLFALQSLLTLSLFGNAATRCFAGRSPRRARPASGCCRALSSSGPAARSSGCSRRSHLGMRSRS